jgi:hypothetical protein
LAALAGIEVRSRTLAAATRLSARILLLFTSKGSGERFRHIGSRFLEALSVEPSFLSNAHQSFTGL